MNKFKNFWNHWAAKSFMALIGIGGYLLRISTALPPSNMKSTLSTVALIIPVLYLAILLASWVVNKTVDYTAQKISNKVNANSLAPQSHIVDDEAQYRYQAQRYGVGYRKFDVQCIIDKDGSAKVIREVELEAFSEISELDTFIYIPEVESDGQGREIRVGNIVSLDGRKLSIKIGEQKPGRMNAMIRITPPLTKGETLAYRIHDFYLPAGMFSVDLTQEELHKRADPEKDYFGWHINRPTQNFNIRVFFPEGKQPDGYKTEVKYALSAGNASSNHQKEEQTHLDRPNLVWNIDRYVLKQLVQYPLSGLIYILRWEPLTKNRRNAPFR